MTFGKVRHQVLTKTWRLRHRGALPGEMPRRPAAHQLGARLTTNTSTTSGSGAARQPCHFRICQEQWWTPIISVSTTRTRRHLHARWLGYLCEQSEFRAFCGNRLLVCYRPASHAAFEFFVGYTHSFAGEFIRQNGGEDVNYRTLSHPIKLVLPVRSIINGPFSWCKDNLPFQFRFVHSPINLRRLVERKGLTVRCWKLA
jgi:hypothetical protein